MPTISLVLILMCAVVIVVGIYEIHSLPGDIARRRGHPQSDAITVCSILGLLIFPLWMFALVWAYAGVIGSPYALPEPATAPVSPPPGSADDDASGADGEGGA